MNPKVLLVLCLAACANATLFTTSLGLTASSAGSSAGLTGLVGGTATGGTLFVTTAGFAVGAGLLALKAIALSEVLAARSKRSADNQVERTVAIIAAGEPQQCYKRFVCDLATGTLPRSENDVILSLFNKPASIESPVFDFNTAAVLGKQLKNTVACEVRYNCPLTGAQIQKILA
jgi:hypothetical protein